MIMAGVYNATQIDVHNLLSVQPYNFICYCPRICHICIRNVWVGCAYKRNVQLNADVHRLIDTKCVYNCLVVCGYTAVHILMYGN